MDQMISSSTDWENLEKEILLLHKRLKRLKTLTKYILQRRDKLQYDTLRARFE